MKSGDVLGTFVGVTTPTNLLLVSGSTRAASTNTATLRTVRADPPSGTTVIWFDGLSDLPAFNPDDEIEPVHPAVQHLRAELAAADAVIFCTPEYAGSLPGSLKNLLDWTVGHGDLYEKPVAWINVAAEGRGGGAQAALATVLGYVSAMIIEEGCLRMPVPRGAIGPEGTIRDPALRARLGAAVSGLSGALRPLAP